jgi:hypothetical protein
MTDETSRRSSILLPGSFLLAMDSGILGRKVADEPG